MTRVQVLLTEDADRRLEDLAATRGESKSSLVRRAVDLLLQLEERDDEPLLALAGQVGRAGTRHGARDHDRLLAGGARRRGAR
ncbi:ribbon-helix-helix protein, CopG family [bacterium]|nr:ribbon-helix-helix protein, CopG family [bacterium]